MSAATTYSRDTTDILDEQVDSSSILINRLDAWRHAVSIVHNFAHQTLHTQNSITAGLSKQHKAVSDLPSFNGSSVSGTAASTAPTSPRSASVLAGQSGSTGAAGANSSPGGTSAISSAFQSLARQTDTLWQESDQVAASIKSSIIPQLDALASDLEKHHKTLRTQGNKLSKEVEKHREITMKHLEHLGRTVSVANGAGQKPDPKNDPYVLHRKVRGVAAEQIGKENQFSESNLNVQNNFGSLEQHIIEVLQNAIASLNELTQRYGQATAQASASTERQFAAIQPSQEWNQFKQANSSALVPDTGFQRDPSRVTFANSDAESTVPIIEGTLSRKGTVLKGHKPGYYVLTPTGFLHQFKSSDYLQDSHPELSLYIPESEISGLPAAGSGGEQTFKIVSRDSNKVLSPRHKYTFSASSYEELVAWHTAIAQVAGATAVSNTLDNAEADEDPGAESVYEAGAIPPGSAAATTTGAPTSHAAQQQGFGSPTGTASTGFSDAGAGSSGYGSAAGAAGGAGAGGLAGGLAGSALGGSPRGQGLQRDAAPQQQLQSGIGHDNSQLGGGQQPLQSGLGESASQFSGGPQQFQSGLGQDASQLGGGGQQFQSGLGQDASRLSSGPQQFQSGLDQDASKLSSGPQQFQSGVEHDTSKLSSGPQQFQSGVDHDASKFNGLGGSGLQGAGDGSFGQGAGAAGIGGLGAAGLGSGLGGGLDKDASKLSSGPQQFQSGLDQDTSKLSSGPQQFQSGIEHDASKLNSGPQKFQQGLDKDASKLSSGPQQFQSDLDRDASKLSSGPQQLQSNFNQDASKLTSSPDQFQSGLRHDANAKFGSGSQQFQTGLDRDTSGLSGGPQQFQSDLNSGLSGGGGSQGVRSSSLGQGVGAATGLGGLGAAGAGGSNESGYGSGFGNPSGNNNNTSSHAYNQFASESHPQGSSAYSTPQQPTQGQFQDQRFGDDTTPFTTSERVEGLRLDDGGAQRGSAAAPLGQGPLTTSEQLDNVKQQRTTSGYGSTSGYDNNTPRSPTGYGASGHSSGYGDAPRSPAANYSDAPRSPAQGTGVVAGSAPRSPPSGGGDTSGFQGSRAASGASGKSAQSGVPHYKLSPSKRATLQSDRIDGSGVGGTFGAIPVSPAAESPAREAVKDHQEKVPEEQEVHHHHHLHLHHHNQPEIQHKGHRHNPDEGLPGAHIQEKPREEFVASSTPSTPRYESAKPTSGAQAFTQSGYGSPRLGDDKSGLGNVKARDVNYSKPEPSAYPTIASGKSNPLVGSEAKYDAPSAAASSAAGPDLNNIASRDVQYSHPKPSDFSTIATGSTNPLLDSQTHYNAPAAPGGEGTRNLGGSNATTRDIQYSRPDPSQVTGIAAGNTNPLLDSSTSYNAPAAPGGEGTRNLGGSNATTRDIQYSRPDPSQVTGIAAGNTNPLLDSSTSYNAPAAPGGDASRQTGGTNTASPRDIQYSRPDPSQVSGIAAGNANPLLDSSTQYNAPGASSGSRSGVGYGDSNLQSRAAEQFAGSGSSGPGTAGYSDLGSKGQKEPFTIVSTQDVPRGGGHGRNASFEGINHDTGSRLDPLSSKYGATGASGATRGDSTSGTGNVGTGTATGAAAGTVGGGALGYGAGNSTGQGASSGRGTSSTGYGSGSGSSYGQSGGQSTSGYGSSGSYQGDSSGQRTGNSYGKGDASAQPGSTQVTGAAGNTQSTHGFQDSSQKSAGGGGYGDYSHPSGAGSGSSNVGGLAAGGAGGAGAGGALGAAGANSGSHHQQQRGYGSGDYSSQQQSLGGSGQQQHGYGSTGHSQQQQQGYDSGSRQTQQGYSGSSGAGGAGAGAGATGAAAAGTGAGGAGAAATGDSGSQYRPYSQDQHGSKFGGNAGGYSQKDYSSLGPSAGGDAEYLQGPGSDAGAAKNKSGGHGKLAGVAGGIGALGGLAGAAGVPGGGEIGQATGIVGSLGSGGVKNAIKNQIPGMGEVNQAKNLASGNVGSAVGQDVPGYNEASQFSNAAKDIRGGGAADKAESQGVKEAEKAEKPSGFKKLANVFKS